MSELPSHSSIIKNITGSVECMAGVHSKSGLSHDASTTSQAIRVFTNDSRVRLLMSTPSHHPVHTGKPFPMTYGDTVKSFTSCILNQLLYPSLHAERQRGDSAVL